MKENNLNQCILKLPFVSDKCNRRIKKLICTYDLPIKLVNTFGNKSSNALRKRKSSDNQCRCSVCPDLGKYKCKDRFIVYRYTCMKCKEFYIGKTVRAFSTRHAEHRNAIKNKSSSSALYEHIKTQHLGIGDIKDFQVDFIAKLYNSRNTTFTEAQAITHFKPSINRKHEIPCFNLPSHGNHLTFSQDNS